MSAGAEPSAERAGSDRSAPYSAATMARRPPTRWIAPLAIVSLAAAGYGVLASNRSSDGNTATSPAKTGSRRSGTSGTSTKARPRGPKAYTVHAGDTLSGIAVSTGVLVSRIKQLNPDLDAQALQPGQRLRLRP